MRLCRLSAARKYQSARHADAPKDQLVNTLDRFISPPCQTILRPMKVSRNFTGKLVVVIDDDALVLDATSGLLRTWGFRVITALNFDEALRQLVVARRRPDLIVCDYRLSRGQTGIDAIEGLRCAFEIPALVISGDSACPETDLRSNGYQLLHKPLNAEALRAALIEACAPQY
jgi:CheY-like chemotaxis protein